MSQDNPTNKELEKKIDGYFMAIMQALGVPLEKVAGVVYDVNHFTYKENE